MRSISLPSPAAHAHGHNVVLVGFPALLVDLEHLGKVVVADEGRVDEYEWLLPVENLRRVSDSRHTKKIKQIESTHAHRIQFAKRITCRSSSLRRQAVHFQRGVER